MRQTPMVARRATARECFHARVLVTLTLLVSEASCQVDRGRMVGPAGGPWRRLFLDATVIEGFDGVERVFHCVDKHPANPGLRAEPPWELPSSPYLYGTVLRDGDLLRMWYHCIGDRGYRNCDATSIDRLSWERPSVGLVEYAGSRSNSIVTDRNQCHNASVMPWPFVDDGLGRWVPSMASRGKQASSARLGPWTASVGSGRRRQAAGCFGLPMW